MSDKWEVERISDDEYRVRRVGTEAGLGGLVVLGLFWYLVKEFVDFVKENWIYIVSVIGIIVICVIACIIIANKSNKKTGTKIAVAIITALLLMVGLFTIVPRTINGPKETLESVYDVSQTEPTYVYMYVDSTDGLNLRSSPDTSSSSNILFTLPRGAELKILNDDSTWYFVEYVGSERTYTGYVNSKYLRY